MQVVWFKRDLRLEDHAPLRTALNGAPVLLLYVFEPELWRDSHYSERHWRFVAQSLLEMNARLEPLGRRVRIVEGSVVDALSDIAEQNTIRALYSYEESGLRQTYDRDLAVARWCQEKGIPWHEFQSNGVQRGRTHRRGWGKAWHQFMARAPDSPVWEALPSAEPELAFGRVEEWGAERLRRLAKPISVLEQMGGVAQAKAVLDSFFGGRVHNYHRSLSKPTLSHKHCSRISPYLAWGNVSVRQVYQRLLQEQTQHGKSRALSAFNSRLHWHCHFIQKFEAEDRIEFEPMNSGYEQFDDPWDELNEQAWIEGRTGLPYVDACLRCVQQTGYLHFRGRAMLVSVLCHLLGGRWRVAARHLAQWFLDFEPGIHYAQIQMQVGLTGINTLRIYNPVKQGQDHDPDGVFIRKWVPELRCLQGAIVHTPWLLGPIERASLELDYPEPCVDVEEAHRAARQTFWARRQNPLVLQEVKRVLYRHVEQDAFRTVSRSRR